MALARVEKSWLTQKRIARGPEKADEEIRRWAQSAFRRAQLRGNLHAMRARALETRAAATVGAPASPSQWPFTPGGAALAAGVVGSAALVGLWLRRRRQSPPSPSSGSLWSSYHFGLDQLS